MLNERFVDRWLVRGTQFFRAVTRNSTIRGELQARGLSSEELMRGWDFYSGVVGIRRLVEVAGPPATNEADQAMNELDRWDAPAFNTSRAANLIAPCRHRGRQR
jgi:hypothetical protein